MLRRTSQSGSIDPLLIPLLLMTMFAIGSAMFGIVTYLDLSTERDNTASEVASAVSEAEATQKEQLEADFAERLKDPFRTWTSAASLGSISIVHPNTWSAYIDENVGSSSPLRGYFHPSVVPAGDSTRYALRILVDEADYTRTVGAYEDSITDGGVTVKPITIADITGVRITGQIDKDYQGAMVILPVRDKTVRIWTESTAYLSDFDGIVEQLTLEK